MRNFGANVGNNVDFGAVVGGMEANGIQRTPVVNRGANFPSYRVVAADNWVQHAPATQVQPAARAGGSHRQPLAMATSGSDRSYAGGYISDRSESAHEVENLLMGGGQRSMRVPTTTGAWRSGLQPSGTTSRMRPAQRVFAPSSTMVKRTSGTFRPSIPR
ncbi:hypothetical protein GYMLUDRAFT_360412 [Collybiopsis luxurians FD-317 M1]|nr:hypothetical protein GYMLUDRAFT_360412 [Collybiopsis luxurians FD-317 M1]